MLNARLLRTSLENALEPVLGTYSTGNQVTRAVSVIRYNGEIQPPNGTKVEGLEIVLFYPALYPRAMLNMSYKVKEEWTLHLRQWEKGKGVQTAIELLLSADLDIVVDTMINYVPANYEMGLPAGAQIKLINYLMTNLKQI